MGVIFLLFLIVLGVLGGGGLLRGRERGGWYYGFCSGLGVGCWAYG